MAYKEAFTHREADQIVRELSVRRVYTQRELVKRIVELDENEGLEIRTNILPLPFLMRSSSGAQASRRFWKHGPLMALPQSLTREDALKDSRIPLALRMQKFEEIQNKLRTGKLREEDLSYIGMSWYPVQGNDRRKRVVPFPASFEGIKLFAYSENMTSGIDIDKRYIDAAKVKREGATIFASVPSMEEKEPRYNIEINHFPVDGSSERRAVVLSLRTAGEQPRSKQFDHLRYTHMEDPASSDVFRFSNHDIAAYIAATRKFWKEDKNMTPLEMNPFVLLSRKGYDFTDKLDNQVVIYDGSLTTKSKLRNLHLAEKAILMGRCIVTQGPNEIAFWDWDRDGKFKDYTAEK